jgi:hypothetical protein
MRRTLILSGAAAFCVATGLWWDIGHGQAWMATFTGTDYCVNLPAKYQDVCKHYGFWSGFGSVIPWSLFTLGGVFGGLALALRHTNCHVKGCWRLGKHQIAGGEFKVCTKHNPNIEQKHVTFEHIKERCHLYLGGKPGRG